MPKPKEYPIDDCFAGDDFSFTFRFWTTAEMTAGMDVSDRTYTAYLYDPDNETFTNVDFDTSASDLAEGAVNLKLTEAQTTSLPAVLRYKLRETTNGNTRTIFKGAFYVQRDES